MRSKTCTEPNPTKPPTHHTKPQIIVKNSHPIFKKSRPGVGNRLEKISLTKNQYLL